MTKSWPLEILTRAERGAVLDAARRLLPDADVTPFPTRLQGCCSYTLAVMPRETGHHGEAMYIVQFRPMRFALDFRLLKGLAAVYGPYAPRLESLGEHTLDQVGQVQVSRGALVPGVPYSTVQPRRTDLSGVEVSGQKRILSSFADFLARGMMHATSSSSKPACDGKIGRSVRERMTLLSRDLPSAELRAVAHTMLETLHDLDNLPIVLTHGDILPSNIMINTSTRSIEGFIDWAEAEFLPFGLCLYGLEHLLGFPSEGKPGFHYYDSAEQLRRHFWAELAARIPDIRTKRFETQVRLARDIGVLLWYGFAWDDGAVNRVINAEDDAFELSLLRAFLGVKSRPGTCQQPPTCRTLVSKL